MYNPRFPHKLSVKRPKVDSEGEFVLSERGDVEYVNVPLTLVQLIDNEPQRYRRSAAFSRAFSLAFDTLARRGDFVIIKVADEIDFGYRTGNKNTRTEGDVIVSDNKIACPMFMTELFPGDVLTLTDYDRTYTGKVVKKITYNWGSNIWFDEVKN